MRGLPLLAAFVLAAPALAEDTWTPTGGGWSRYTNERLGTKAEVPLAIFRAEPPPANGDGRTFKSKDGAQLWVFGSYGPYAVTDSFEEYKRWLLDSAEKDGLRVTYKAEGKGWLVFSGTKGAGIVYSKVIEGCEAAHHLNIEYPADLKRTYDPIVTRLSRSLGCR